jgi:hypothetical protein
MDPRSPSCLLSPGNSPTLFPCKNSNGSINFLSGKLLSSLVQICFTTKERISRVGYYTFQRGEFLLSHEHSIDQPTVLQNILSLACCYRLAVANKGILEPYSADCHNFRRLELSVHDSAEFKNKLMGVMVYF